MNYYFHLNISVKFFWFGSRLVSVILWSQFLHLTRRITIACLTMIFFSFDDNHVLKARQDVDVEKWRGGRWEENVHDADYNGEHNANDT